MPLCNRIRAVFMARYSGTYEWGGFLQLLLRTTYIITFNNKPNKHTL